MRSSFTLLGSDKKIIDKNLKFRLQLHPFQIMNDSAMPFFIS
jgi:hypothetical protein